MNLLPRPRFVDLGDRRPRRASRRNASTVRSRPRATCCGSATTAVDVIAADDAGAFYGGRPWRSWPALHGGALPVGTSGTIPTCPCAA